MYNKLTQRFHVLHTLSHRYKSQLLAPRITASNQVKFTRPLSSASFLNPARSFHLEIISRRRPLVADCRTKSTKDAEGTLNDRKRITSWSQCHGFQYYETMLDRATLYNDGSEAFHRAVRRSTRPLETRVVCCINFWWHTFHPFVVEFAETRHRTIGRNANSIYEGRGGREPIAKGLDEFPRFSPTNFPKTVSSFFKTGSSLAERDFWTMEEIGRMKVSFVKEWKLPMQTRQRSTFLPIFHSILINFMGNLPRVMWKFHEAADYRSALISVDFTAPVNERSREIVFRVDVSRSSRWPRSSAGSQGRRKENWNLRSRELIAVSCLPVT